MIASAKTLCIVAAVICFAFGVFFGLLMDETTRWGRVSPMALGLFFWACADLFQGP